jgi:hypothetical protein
MKIGFHTGPISSPDRVSNEQMKADYLVQTMKMLIQNMHYSRPICWYIFHEKNADNTYFSLVKKNMNGDTVNTNYLPAYYSFKGMNQKWNYYKK